MWIQDSFSFKFDATQPYFMAYCLESFPQPFSNWKFNCRQRDLNPGPSKYQFNTLPTKLSWLDILETLSQKLTMENKKSVLQKYNYKLFFKHNTSVLCISTSFWVLRAPESWSNYFFAIFNLFVKEKRKVWSLSLTIMDI